MRLSAATTFAILSLVSFLTLAPSAAQARVEPFPPAFKNEMIATNGTKLYVRLGGNGPAVVLLHGYGGALLKLIRRLRFALIARAFRSEPLHESTLHESTLDESTLGCAVAGVNCARISPTNPDKARLTPAERRSYRP